jgi:hypothetical protein
VSPLHAGDEPVAAVRRLAQALRPTQTGTVAGPVAGPAFTNLRRRAASADLLNVIARDHLELGRPQPPE